MTDKAKALVERLRAKYTVTDEFSTIRRPVNPDGHEAADRIEALEAENERLKVEVIRQMKWKTEAQNDVDEMAVALDNIANESSDTWAREKARAALKEIEGD